MWNQASASWRKEVGRGSYSPVFDCQGKFPGSGTLPREMNGNVVSIGNAEVAGNLQTAGRNENKKRVETYVLCRENGMMTPNTF